MDILDEIARLEAEKRAEIKQRIDKLQIEQDERKKAIAEKKRQSRIANKGTRKIVRIEDASGNVLYDAEQGIELIQVKNKQW